MVIKWPPAVLVLGLEIETAVLALLDGKVGGALGVVVHTVSLN